MKDLGPFKAINECSVKKTLNGLFDSTGRKDFEDNSIQEVSEASIVSFLKNYRCRLYWII